MLKRNACVSTAMVSWAIVASKQSTCETTTISMIDPKRDIPKLPLSSILEREQNTAEGDPPDSKSQLQGNEARPCCGQCPQHPRGEGGGRRRRSCLTRKRMLRSMTAVSREARLSLRSMTTTSRTTRLSFRPLNVNPLVQNSEHDYTYLYIYIYIYIYI